MCLRQVRKFMLLKILAFKGSCVFVAFQAISHIQDVFLLDEFTYKFNISLIGLINPSLKAVAVGILETEPKFFFTCKKLIIN